MNPSGRDGHGTPSLNSPPPPSSLVNAWNRSHFDPARGKCTLTTPPPFDSNRPRWHFLSCPNEPLASRWGFPKQHLASLLAGAPLAAATSQKKFSVPPPTRRAKWPRAGALQPASPRIAPQRPTSSPPAPPPAPPAPQVASADGRHTGTPIFGSKSLNFIPPHHRAFPVLMTINPADLQPTALRPLSRRYRHAESLP
jgi:hypothetical protein